MKTSFLTITTLLLAVGTAQAQQLPATTPVLEQASPQSVTVALPVADSVFISSAERARRENARQLRQQNTRALKPVAATATVPATGANAASESLDPAEREARARIRGEQTREMIEKAQKRKGTARRQLAATPTPADEGKAERSRKK